MLDGFKIQLPSYMKSKLLNNPLLDFHSTYSISTGEIKKEKMITKYSNSENTENPLTFTINGNFITLIGSFHKYFQNGTNHQDYSYSQLQDTINDLQTKFQIEPKEAIIRNLEIGTNVDLKVLKVYDLLSCCMLYKTKGFGIEYFNGKGKLLRVENWQYEVKIYDKGKQYLLGNTLLRIEKKFTKMEKIGHATLDTLLQPDFIAKACDELILLWDDILLSEPNVDLSHLKTHEKEFYKDWCNPVSLEKLAKNDKNKFKYQRKVFKQLVKDHCKESLHNQVAECLFTKLLNYEKEMWQHLNNSKL